MKLDEFRDRAQRFGGDIGRWPERNRLAAKALAEASPAAAAALAEACALDRLIELARPEVAPERVDRAIGNVGRRLARPVRRAWWLRLMPVLAPATSFACAAVIGVALGLAQPVLPTRQDGAEVLVSLVLDGPPLPRGWFY